MNRTKEDILWAVINKMLFIPYKWGGDDPFDGYDCSGGIQEILDSIGLDPKGDQTSDRLFHYFKNQDRGEEVDSAKFGDLLFFGKKEKIIHIAIAVNKTVMFEFGGGGSKTKTLNEAKEANAYGRFRRIHRRNDLQAIIRLKELI